MTYLLVVNVHVYNFSSNVQSAFKNLIPLADRVLIKRISPMTKTLGGILLPESNIAKSNEGEVLAVGPGYKTKTGDFVQVSVAVGDTVLLPEYGGLQVKAGGEEAFLFRSDEILAKYAK